MTQPGTSAGQNDLTAGTERFVDVDPHYRLWVEERGAGTPLLLVMGANASGITWPEHLVERLAHEHRVIRYDHRDTGRSTWAYDNHPYAIRDLATDIVAVLDALEIDRAHVVGMSLGGTLAQLLLTDHPQRLLSATVFATSALGAGLADPEGLDDLPGPKPELLELWEHLGDERTPDEEIAWRIEHWRILNGDVLSFNPQEWEEVEQKVLDHTGSPRNAAAHALADQSGIERGDELAKVEVPTLVIDAPEDPVNPPPHPQYLASAIPGARLVTIPGMGHALPGVVVPPLADAVLTFAAEVDGRPRQSETP